MSHPPVAVRGLGKAYGSTVALHGLDLDVGPGEVVGLLGPNGAGKTTTVKILLGLAAPSVGDARLFGAPSGAPGARRRVGYLPELFRFHDWLTGREAVQLHARLAGLGAAARQRRVPAALEQVGLGARSDDRVRGYSKGMSQRLGIAAALVAGPELVILDEPTSALDPVGRRQVRDLIRELRAGGTAVLLNSHLLSEVELVCDRVVIMDRGRAVRSGRLGDLLPPATGLRVTLDRVDDHAHAVLAAFGSVRVQDATTATVELADAGAGAAVVAALVQAGCAVHAAVPLRRSLEELFVSVVTGGE